MKLYYTPKTISIAVAIALEESGLDYECQHIDFSTGEQQSEAYAQINPKCRVPTLQTEGMKLTETGAILEYIATLVPSLMPSEPIAASHARSVMYFLASTMHVNHAHKVRGSRWADRAESHADMVAKVPETMATSAAYIDTNCITGPFVLGDTFCIADAYLFQVCTWLKGDGVDPVDYPKIQNLMDAMEARASVKCVRAQGMLG